VSEKSLKERFQEKLDGSRWTGSTNNIGYPKMKVDGEMVLGSHVALRLAGRKAPTGGPAGGKIVMHKDNNKLNLSPSNLEVGTHKANLKQMRDEGRDRPRGVRQEPDEKRGGIDILKFAFKLQGETEHQGIPKLGKTELQAEALHDDLARVPRADLHSHHPPPKGSEKGILAFVPRFDQRALVHTAVDLDGNHSRNVGKVDVVPPHGVVDDEFHPSSKKAVSEHRLRPGDGLRGLSGSGNVLVPPVSAFGVGAHSVPLPAEPLLHRGGGAPNLRGNFGSTKSGGVEGPHLFRGDRQSSHVAKVAASSGGSKLRGHAVVSGIPIAIEKRIGDIRSGVGADGVKWKTRLSMPYGYIKGSEGADGEDIDCYVGPHKDAPNAYVVHQRKSDGTGYDEDKVLLGLRSKEEATKGYLAHYNSDKFLGPVKEVPVERLKEMLSTGKKLEKISTSLCARVLRRG